MRADNVLLFTLLWTFTAVCQADDDISVSCDEVTGFVGKEVNLTCRVSLQRPGCCIRMYKYFEMYEDSVICKNWFPRDSCEQRNSLTCSYTPTTAMTQFRFFLQTRCGTKTTQFTVDLTESLKHEADPAAPDETGPVINIMNQHHFFIITVCCSIIIFIIIIAIVLCVKRLKNTNASGSQKRYERGASEEQTTMTTKV